MFRLLASETHECSLLKMLFFPSTKRPKESAQKTKINSWFESTLKNIFWYILRELQRNHKKEGVKVNRFHSDFLCGKSNELSLLQRKAYCFIN